MKLFIHRYTGSTCVCSTLTYILNFMLSSKNTTGKKTKAHPHCFLPLLTILSTPDCYRYFFCEAAWQRNYFERTFWIRWRFKNLAGHQCGNCAMFAQVHLLWQDRFMQKVKSLTKWVNWFLSHHTKIFVGSLAGLETSREGTKGFVMSCKWFETQDTHLVGIGNLLDIQ